MSKLPNLNILDRNVKVSEKNRRVSRFEQRTLLLNRTITIRSSVEKKTLIRKRGNSVKPMWSLFGEDIIKRVCFVILMDGRINDEEARLYSIRG